MKTKDSFPNVWGEGNLFAYSGFDGKTDWSYPMVSTLLEDKIGFTIRTEREKKIWIVLRNKNKICEFINKKKKNSFDHFSEDVVAGDYISLDFGIKRTKIHFLTLPASKSEFLMELNPQTKQRGNILYLIFRIEACKQLFFKSRNFVMKTDRDTIYTRISPRADDYFVVDSMEEVRRVVGAKAEKRPKRWDGDKEVRYLIISRVLKKDNKVNISISSNRKRKGKPKIPGELKSKTKTFYTNRLTTTENRTLAKAFGILKVNIESPQGVFKQRWTTPDRYPHRHLWLWDSCFHSLGYLYIDKKLAEDSILSVLDIRQKNGFIPHIGRPNGDVSNITQPPLLSWAVYSIYEHTGNIKFLRKCYPTLVSYLNWCSSNRDKNGNGLLEWFRNDESGLDNSSRFNYGCRFDAVDFSSFYVNDLNYLYHISKKINKPNQKLKDMATSISNKIKNYLWHRKKGFFFDRYFNKRFSIFKTACGFLPLFSSSATRNQAEKLVNHLTSKKEFNTTFPVPSESIDSPTFDNNMWRGPVWLNYNYFIIEGLKNYGFNREAKEIKETTLRQVEKWYRKEGTIFEFYDPFGKMSPRKIPRKDKYGAIKEFGWSAAIYVVLTYMSDA
jgi:glycogen debranching enzyme